METRYAHHPEDIKNIHNRTITQSIFLVEKNLCRGRSKSNIYACRSYDFFGGVMPKAEVLTISLSKELGVSYFLERREMGVINIGGDGVIVLDGVEYDMKRRDGLYVGKRNKRGFVLFQGCS
ncbi:hypothetical protein GCM10020331_084410 [Ectobacillus funiculus]